MNKVDIKKTRMAALCVTIFTVALPAQPRFACLLPSSEHCLPAAHGFSFGTSSAEPDEPSPSPQPSSGQDGPFLHRTFKRGLEDQKELYTAPFRPSNFKWDIPFLAGSGALLATDRRIERHLPDGHFQLYQNSSNIGLGGLAASAAAVWVYGVKTENPHAKETGVLALETVTNTFLFYAPMQLIAGRQRPGEGNGRGDFLQHHALNTSFPGGHAMFTWSLATVIAREYPKPWVRILAYGTALAVTNGRFLARDHWSSDMFIGSALGFAIGTHIFHAHCDPDLSSSCHRHPGE